MSLACTAVWPMRRASCTSAWVVCGAVRKPLITSFRMCTCGRETGNRQRRRIGGKHTLRAHDRFKLAQQRLLDVELFDDRLDDQIAPAELLQRGAGHDACDGRLCIRFREAAFADQFGEHVGQHRTCGSGGFGMGVVELDVKSGKHGDLGDAASHRAGADDSDRMDGKGCVFDSGRCHSD